MLSSFPIPANLADVILSYACPHSYFLLPVNKYTIKQYLNQVNLDPFYDPWDVPWRVGCIHSLLVNPETRLVLLLSIDSHHMTYRLEHMQGNPTVLFHVLKRSFPWLFKMVAYKKELLLDQTHFEVVARDLVYLCKALRLSWIPKFVNENTMSFADIWFPDLVPLGLTKQFDSPRTRIF
jgi:hypothetical protein